MKIMTLKINIKVPDNEHHERVRFSVLRGLYRALKVRETEGWDVESVEIDSANIIPDLPVASRAGQYSG